MFLVISMDSVGDIRRSRFSAVSIGYHDSGTTAHGHHYTWSWIKGRIDNHVREVTRGLGPSFRN